MQWPDRPWRIGGALQPRLCTTSGSRSWTKVAQGVDSSPWLPWLFGGWLHKCSIMDTFILVTPSSKNVFHQSKRAHAQLSKGAGSELKEQHWWLPHVLQSRLGGWLQSSSLYLAPWQSRLETWDIVGLQWAAGNSIECTNSILCINAMLT